MHFKLPIVLGLRYNGLIMVVFKEEKSMARLSLLKQKQEERLVKMLAAKHKVGYVDLNTVPINTDALKLIPEDRAKAAGVAVFNMANKKVAVASLSPHNPLVNEEVTKLVEKKYEVVLYMTSHRSLKKAWSRYGDISYAVQTEEGVIDLSSADMEDVIREVTSLKKAETILNQALASKQAYRISKVIEIILYAAYALGASDVHVEPGEKEVVLRYRLDGILSEIARLDHATYARILSRIKLTAGLKLNIRENAQDGRFSIIMAEHNIEIRTSTLPEPYGESIVMRLLDPRSIAVELESLGMHTELLTAMKREIKRPNGLILNTGPTGSGKSTTLFAFLKRIITPQIKIITIENPIEYHVAGVVQTQVDIEKGYTFLSGLRAALRQDPDVIMVGEIRDTETAKIAANSALTGHLVLSTLHTNSAAGTFARLIDLGVSAETISVALNVALAQRLVRKLCVHCKKQVTYEDVLEYDREKINTIVEGVPNIEKHITQQQFVYEPTGCDECNGLGYKGRIGLFEAIFMDDELAATLKTTSSEIDIQKSVRRQKQLTLPEDGVVKLFAGVTSLEELYRVIDLG